MTKSRQENSEENKLLFHYRFFYSAFLPRKSKSNIYLCKVTLLFFEDIAKTQQWPRIWQKQHKKNLHQQFGNMALLPLCVQQSSLTHTFSLTHLISVFKNFIKSRIRCLCNKPWVPAISRDRTLIQLFWNDTYHLLVQLFNIYVFYPTRCLGSARREAWRISHPGR